ncbi:hypothetical protein phytr_2530 [Candidatus Phycorickettsia trachydisci]|uniref:Uncharacterized protein n=1 Tax=Candidatus Phycorickettsia trachydisci TaxID=2115978 RepID=A0A2P1P7H2_9RICK|nr:hypothetical protein phytr_2530 [Candidatus Phycorickettsia trachydisci]
MIYKLKILVFYLDFVLCLEYQKYFQCKVKKNKINSENAISVGWLRKYTPKRYEIYISKSNFCSIW